VPVATTAAETVVDEQKNGDTVAAAETLSGAHIPAATSETLVPPLLEPGALAAPLGGESLASAPASETAPAPLPAPAKIAKMFAVKPTPAAKRAKVDK
jgi:hypothetical protein